MSRRIVWCDKIDAFFGNANPTIRHSFLFALRASVRWVERDYDYDWAWVTLSCMNPAAHTLADFSIIPPKMNATDTITKYTINLHTVGPCCHCVSASKRSRNEKREKNDRLKQLSLLSAQRVRVWVSEDATYRIMSRKISIFFLENVRSTIFQKTPENMHVFEKCGLDACMWYWNDNRIVIAPATRRYCEMRRAQSGAAATTSVRWCRMWARMHGLLMCGAYDVHCYKL